MNAPVKPSKHPLATPDWPESLGQVGDELDRLAIDQIAKRARLGERVAALEFDCGAGEQALRMARAGAFVLATDREDRKAALADAARALEVSSRVGFMQLAPACADTAPLPGSPFDVVVCHRGLSPLPYPEAVSLVRRLLMMTRTGGKLYFTAYGMHSELADRYPDRDKRVQRRFTPLAPEVAAKYGIAGSICLYSERDLFVLLFEAGASILKTFTTTHGSVKAIAVRV